jgi:hypothetical protein
LLTVEDGRSGEKSQRSETSQICHRAED